MTSLGDTGVLVMTDDEKITLAEEILTMGHLELFGGYPAAYRWFGNIFIYCRTHGAMTITRMTRSSLVVVPI